MKIITGSLKGRKIPFENKKFKNADITPQKVKEALFSILGSKIYGAVFLDLYGCSGQIGFEAYSRGAEVIINERDKQRFDFIWKTAEKYGILTSISLFNYSDTVCLRYLSRKEQKVSLCFLDPPYIKEKGGVDYYGTLLLKLEQSGVLAPDAVVVVQYFTKNTLTGVPGCFQRVDDKQYGTTSLSIFRYVNHGAV